MEFRIADTFTDSLAKLQGDEQKAAKTTAFDLQLDPANPGMRFHKLDRAKDKNFWSVRVSSDIRLIVHKSDKSLLLCYVNHHDKAYLWAERRRIERHPKTGAMQIVEIRERVLEIEVPKYVEVEKPLPPKPALLANIPDDKLLTYGVPEEWLADVKAANEDTLFDVASHLPQEAAEAVFELATGGSPAPPSVAATEDDPFVHPDAQRRFRLVADNAELERALEYPWEKWAVFLHPAQRETVERDFGGPAKVAGSAGTGKTIVALHRAVHLANKYPSARVLLTTFSIALARLLRRKLTRLIGDDVSLGERIFVRAIDEVGIETYETAFGKPKILTPSMLRSLLSNASKAVANHNFSLSFLESEFRDVVDAWQLKSWEDYRDVARLGRRTRLGQKQRESLWEIFENTRSALLESGSVSKAGMFAAATELVVNGEASPADYVVVDEAQDISVPQLRFFAAVAGDKENGLFFAGDLGQRIFQSPFSWKALGVDVRGRSQTLRINYRTSHQIRVRADRLLGTEIADVDGNEESRKSIVSAFSGPHPNIEVFDSADDERRGIAAWLEDRIKSGLRPEETGVFVRSDAELPRGRAAIEAANLKFLILDASTDVSEGKVSLCPMHFAKGMEFRAVVVAACDDEIIPLQSRIESVADEADLEDVYNTERHLLYVACTRARDYLLITAVDPASEFLDDLRNG
ncbi:MAG: UvrD-helicase domain-containing protein [Phycisphaerae bacterium]|nr:UvrD-helicase domain-containing protein [Phycisphaerales bacterium]